MNFEQEYEFAKGRVSNLARQLTKAKRQRIEKYYAWQFMLAVVCYTLERGHDKSRRLFFLLDERDPRNVTA